MARVAGKDGFISLNGQDMSGESNSFTITIESDTFEVTAFSDAAKTHVEGKYGWSVDFEAFYDNSDNKWADLLVDQLGQGALLGTFAPEGTAADYYSGNVFRETWDIETPVDGAITVSGTLRGSGALTKTDV